MSTARHGSTRVYMSRSRAPFVLYRRTKTGTDGTILLRNWYVRFRGTDSDGRRRRFFINLKTEDRQEAERRAAELLLRMGSPAFGSSSDPFLSALLPEYRQHLLASTARKTALNRWSVLRQFFSFCFPQDHSKIRLSEVTTNIISRYIDRQKLEKNIQPWTVFEIRKSLSALFGYAIRQHGFASNPVKNVPMPRLSGGVIDYLKLSQITPLLEALRQQTPILYAPVAAAIFAGLRRSEVIWLTWEDIDLDRRILVIRFKTIGGERYQPKTNRSRVVPISNELFSIFSGLERQVTWVFPSPQGKRWHPNNLGKRLHAVMKAHGWEYGFLTFRHTFGSQLAQKGLSLYKISKLMGNSEDVCREHYAALAVEEMQTDISFPTGLKSSTAGSR